MPEPLLAPPAERRWRVLWSSDNVAYGGDGIAEPETVDGQWRFSGHAATVLIAA